MSLTALLRAQHDELRGLLVEVERALGHARRLAGALERLRLALSAHLEAEERGLYPALAGSPVAATFARNGRALSVAVDAFFEQHHPPRGDPAELARDWAAVARLLTERMQSEEASLYPLWEAKP